MNVSQTEKVDTDFILRKENNTIERKNNDLNKFFIFLFICGFILIVLTPPMAIPDENAHFINTYTISKGDIFPDYNAEYSKVGKSIPLYISEFINTYNSKYAGNFEQKVTYSELYFLSWLEVSDEDRTPFFYTNRGLGANPFSYFFGSIGLSIGTALLNIVGKGYDTAYNLLLVSRLSNFIAYCILGCLAIRRTPCLKKVMMLLMVNPTMLFVCASTSYDAIIIPFSMLLAAEIFHLLSSDMLINKTDIAIVMACTIFMTAVKMGYAPFLLLLLLIPFSKYRNKKQFWFCVIGVVICAFIGGVMPSLISSVHARGYVAPVQEEIAIQKEYLLTHIYRVPEIVINSFTKYGVFYFSGFFGKLGQLDTNYPVPILVLFFCGLIYVTFAEAIRTIRIPIKFKICSFVALIISIIGMFLAMYIDWTPRVEPPMGNTVSGVQGRYFFPLYIYISMIFMSSNYYKLPPIIQRFIDGIENHIYILLLVIQPLSAIILVLQRFWI